MKCPHCQGLGRQPQGTSLAKYLQFQSAVCSCGQQMFFTNKAHFEWHLVLCLNVLGSICLTFGRLKATAAHSFCSASPSSTHGYLLLWLEKFKSMDAVRRWGGKSSLCSSSKAGSKEIGLQVLKGARRLPGQTHRVPGPPPAIPSDILWWWLPCAEPPVAPLARDLYWWGGHSTSAAGQVPALLWARRRGLVFGWMRPSRICRTKLNRRTPTRMGWRFTTWLQCSECARILSCY